jgi:hypothetical protein
MGECPPSGSVMFYESRDGKNVGEVWAEFWDRGHPYEDDEPRVNFTAEDYERNEMAYIGLNLAQARELRDVLNDWVDRQ